MKKDEVPSLIRHLTKERAREVQAVSTSRISSNSIASLGIPPVRTLRSSSSVAGSVSENPSITEPCETTPFDLLEPARTEHRQNRKELSIRVEVFISSLDEGLGDLFDFFLGATKVAAVIVGALLLLSILLSE